MVYHENKLGAGVWGDTREKGHIEYGDGDKSDVTAKLHYFLFRSLSILI